MSQDVADPLQRPADIVVADASPLIHLAQADALHLLHTIGGAVVLVDIVADEVTRDVAEPGAAAPQSTLRCWLEAARQPGSDTPVWVEMTETGRAIAAARRADPGFAMRNGGESVIIAWLTERVVT